MARISGSVLMYGSSESRVESSTAARAELSTLNSQPPLRFPVGTRTACTTGGCFGGSFLPSVSECVGCGSPFFTGAALGRGNGMSFFFAIRSSEQTVDEREQEHHGAHHGIHRKEGGAELGEIPRLHQGMFIRQDPGRHHQPHKVPDPESRT